MSAAPAWAAAGLLAVAAALASGAWVDPAPNPAPSEAAWTEAPHRESAAVECPDAKPGAAKSANNGA